MADLSMIVAELNGSWTEKLTIGNEEIWNVEKHRPTWAVPVKYPLPSDSRFREDLIWNKYGNLGYADEWKTKLENILDKEEAARAKLKKK